VYRPAHHKLAHRGKTRSVAVGPKAQQILARFLPADPADYFFSPRRAVAALHAARTANRKTPKYPSHMARNAAKRGKGRPHSNCYTADSYGRAVGRGVERCNADRARHNVPEGAHGPNLPRIPHWHPNQLRHAHATEVRKRYGLEAAGASLGHSKMSATEVYAERDMGLATRVALELG
jgi:site-specific recombinase XerC